MSTRRVHEAPSFSRVEDPKVHLSLIREIIKIKPPVEVSIEGSHEVLKGRIVEWNSDRKIFTVAWHNLSDTFHTLTGSKTGLRSYFKVKLFTTQLVFRAEAVRRMPEGHYHYRFPTELFQQQKRGALRVPLARGVAKLKTLEGTFPVEDLSVGGARIVFDPEKGRELHELTGCELYFGDWIISTPEFCATLTHRTERGSGIRFSGLNEAVRTELKQFLIEALRSYYQEAWK
jgi:hypothetical protein